jgi:hypothetical protein
MPKGTKVDKLFKKLKSKGLPVDMTAATAQKVTKQGKPLKKKKK